MTEAAIKKRVLSKVRSQFLHKRPPNEDEIMETTNLIATPEQLNENSARLLEISIGLVEINRKIYAGYQFLNLNYKVGDLRVESPFQSQIVTLDIQSNDVETLPLEYCIERLESYGDLELATWANRLKIHHKTSSEIRKRYLAFVNSRDPQMMEIVAKGIEQTKQRCCDIESKFPFRKVVFYGNKDSLTPISFTIHEGLLKHIGHTVDDFTRWTKKHGIPALFKKDCSIMIEHCKRYLSGSSDGQQSFFREGPEYITDVYDKKDQRKPSKMRMDMAISPAPGGFFLTLYSFLLDPQPEVITSNSIGYGDVLSERKASKSGWNTPKCEEIEPPEPCPNDTTKTERMTHDP